MDGLTLRPELEGSFGAVASTHWLASAAGFGILERGGNAFDAAVATGFVHQVVEPHLNGPAGEAPMILHVAEEDRVVVVAGQGSAPQGATIEAFAGLGLDMVPGSGLLAACIPAAFDSWMHVLARYGTMTLADVLEPAIHYAETGFPVSPAMAESIAAVKDLFVQEWPGSAALWLDRSEVPQAGMVWRNRALAATFRRILDEAQAAGPDRIAQIEAARSAWSDGFVAEAIARFVRQEAMDTSGRRHAGLICGDDLAGWRVGEEAPVTFDYGPYSLCKCDSWSQGPVFLQQLALLKGFDLAAMDPEGPDFIHVVVEAAKLAFADREAYYGDPHYVDVPLKALLSPEHNAARRTLIGGQASLEDRPSRFPGIAAGRTPVQNRSAVSATVADEADSIFRQGVGEPAQASAASLARRLGGVRGDTVHFDVCDRWGNMVSATPSGGWLMSSPAIADLGFCLGTRAQMFWLEPGHPSALAPGKRPRSTLTPGFALYDGRAGIAFGTPGGDQQDQWSLIAFLRHVHHGMTLQRAIESPAFHSSHFASSFYPRDARPGVVTVEGRIRPGTIAELRRRGHRVEVAPDWSQGWISAVRRMSDGRILAGVNPRGSFGYATAR